MASFDLAVGINARGAKRGASEVKVALDGIKGKSKGANTALKRTETRLEGVGRAARAAKGFIVALFAGAAVRKLAQAADAYTKLGNQINLVTANSTEAAVIQAELFDLANRSRAPIAEIGTLYGRAALSARELGATQGELLQFTEGVAQALAINGSNAQEARGALIQLSQALGSGIVRAEEFNAVLEGARPVLIAVADGMGKTVAQLRQMVIDGKITSREFFEAFQSQLGNLQTQFDKTNKTIGQAGVDINNAFIQAVGTLDQLAGASNGIVEIFGVLAEFIRGDMVNGIIAFSVQVGVLINDFDNLFSAVQDLGAVFINFVSGSIPGFKKYKKQVEDNLKSPWQSFRTLVGLVTIELAAAFDRLAATDKFVVAANVLEAQLKESDRVLSLFDEADRTGGGQAQAMFERELERNKELTTQLNRTRTAAEPAQQAIDEINANALLAQNKVIDEGEERLKQIEETIKNARTKFTDAEREATLAGTPSLGKTPTNTKSDPDKKLVTDAKKFNEANDPAIKFKNTLQEIQDLQTAAANEGIVISQTAVNNAIQDAVDAYSGFNEVLEEGKDLTESLLEPQEIYNASIEKFTELLEKGAISEETFNRARKAAAETLAEANEQFAFLKEAGETTAFAVRDAFADILLTGGANLSELAQQFSETLRRMAAEFLANQAIKFLLNAAGNSIGGQFGGALTNLAGEFAEGGRIPPGQVGIVGEAGPELVSGPANVTSAAATASMLAPEVGVNVVNVTNSADALDVLNTSAGDKAIMNVMRRQSAAIKREFGLA